MATSQAKIVLRKPIRLLQINLLIWQALRISSQGKMFFSLDGLSLKRQIDLSIW